MSDFRKHLERSLENADFKEEWDAEAAEREVMRRIVEARVAEGAVRFSLRRVGVPMPLKRNED